MRVVFLTHHFPPEIGAPQSRIFETAEKLVKFGHKVVVLTGMPNYPTGIAHERYRDKLFMHEQIQGIDLFRTWVFATPNRAAVPRILNHLSFALSSLFGALKVGQCDVIVVNSPPLLLGASGYAISRLKRAPLVVNVADLWPASAIELGVLRNRTAIKLAQELEAFIYRKACKTIGVTAGVTQGVSKVLDAKGTAKGRIALIPNGTDTTLFNPGADGEAARKALKLEDKFVVMYAGTIGLAQGLDVVLETAKLLRDDKQVRFVLIGEGVDKENLIDKADREGIDNVSFSEPQPRSEMPGILNAADAVLVILRNLPLFEGAVPSKMSEAMACGRPVIMAVAGEAAALLQGAKAGLTVEPENPVALADAVRKLREEPELAAEMGSNGREFAVEHLDRTKLARRLEKLLVGVTGSSRHSSKLGRS